MCRNVSSPFALWNESVMHNSTHVKQNNEHALRIRTNWSGMKIMDSSTEKTVACFYNISKVYIALFPNLKQNLLHTHCTLQSAIFWRNGDHWGTTHSHTSEGITSQWWSWNFEINSKWLVQILLELHMTEKFCTNCSRTILWPVQKLPDQTSCSPTLIYWYK
jgi:hypothetical protein